MTKAECYQAGFVMKPHGLKGEVTLSLDSDAPVEWHSLPRVFIEIKNQLVPYFLENISVKGSKAFVKFEDVNTIEEAKKIEKLAFYLPKVDRPALSRGDFYTDEVIGFAVEDANLGNLGKVTHIEHIGPNRYLVIKGHEKELIIPVQGPFIASLNRATQQIFVELPDGFLSL